MRRSVVALWMLAWGAVPAFAQTWPNGAVTFLVPYAAGGSADIVARLIGQKLQERIGRPVVIDNRPGGSEMIVTEAIARSDPDGQTIGILSNAIAINETLVPNRRFDVERDLSPVVRVIELPFALMVHPSVPARSADELVKYAKANPGKLNYGHLGPGSPHFFKMEWFKRTAGVDIVAVPYKGAAPAYVALVSGEVQVIASGLGAATPFLDAGQAIALAAFSSRRPSSQPNLPTIAEAGFKDFNLRSWMGIFVRKGTAPQIERKLEAEVLAALGDPDLKGRLDKLGLDISPMGSDEFPAFVRGEVKAWEGIVKATASQR
ncbi:MAG: Bug family tripartite tricarboxylate transporter substrate binding protein [Pseudorhodoplanes sp.]